jgi:hypothetical protein
MEDWLGRSANNISPPTTSTTELKTGKHTRVTSTFPMIPRARAYLAAHIMLRTHLIAIHILLSLFGEVERILAFVFARHIFFLCWTLFRDYGSRLSDAKYSVLVVVMRNKCSWYEFGMRDSIYRRNLNRGNEKKAVFEETREQDGRCSNKCLHGALCCDAIKGSCMNSFQRHTPPFIPDRPIAKKTVEMRDHKDPKNRERIFGAWRNAKIRVRW